jgi:histidine triad (HIT) family protein
VARAVKAALKPDGIVVTQFNGAPAGQTVFHLHVHIIPRWEGVPLGRHAEGMADVEELKALAVQISAALEPA